MSFNPDSFLSRVTAYVAHDSKNEVRVEVEEIDNGQVERFWYSGLRRYNGLGVYIHVEESAVGHGYGEGAKRAAFARAAQLVDGGWRRFMEFGG